MAGVVKFVSVHSNLIEPPAVVVRCWILRSWEGAGKEIGLVSPTVRLTVNVPTLPAQTSWPVSGKTTVVKHVAGVQLPEKVTVPLASMVALFPAVSVILKIGGVAALAGATKAIMPKRHRSTNTCNLELKRFLLTFGTSDT